MKTKIFQKLAICAMLTALSTIGCKKAEVAAVKHSPPLIASPILAINAGEVVQVPVDPHLTAAIKHLTKSSDYKVEVKLSTAATWQTAFVYRSDNYPPIVASTPSQHRAQNSASFFNFSITAGQVANVRVTILNTGISFTGSSDVKIRPLSYGINLTGTDLVNKSFTFNIVSGQKVSVEVHDRLNPLFIFTDAPEVTPAPSSVTHYFAAGTTTAIGYHGITIHSNDKVYIAGGAVVQGTFLFDQGASNVQFSGHGVITSGDVDHPSNLPDDLFPRATFAGTVKSNASSSCTWDGLTIVNGAAFIFGAVCSFNNSTHDNHWTDIKEVHWNANTDPLWFDGHNNSASDLFLFCNDDVTTHGSTTVTISKLVYWQGGNGGHLFLTSNYASTDFVTYDNIDVIGNDNVGQMISFHGDQGNSGIHCSNMTFKNIRVEATRNTVSSGTFFTNHFVDIVPQGDNKALNWLFQDITMANQNPTLDGTFIGNSLGGTQDINVRFVRYNVPGHTPCFSLSDAKMTNNGYTSVTYTSN